VWNFLSTLAHLYHPRHSNAHRPRVLHPEAFVFYAVILVWLAGALPWFSQVSPRVASVLGFASSITAEQVIEQTNQVRQGQGLPALKYNANLAQAAQAKGQDMLANQYWAHTSPAGKQPWSFMSAAGYRYQVAGENLARDFSNTADMIQAWLASPTHRANVLNNRYSEIGVAVLPGALGGYETTLVVQMFGSPKAAAVTVKQQGDTLVAVEAPAPTVAVTQPLSLQPTVEPTTAIILPKPAILAAAAVPAGTATAYPLFSPKLLLEVVGLAMTLMLIATLLYDWFWTTQRKIDRLVGQNWAHVVYLTVVAMLLVLYRSGVIS
jgi:uncharacterized protein YkwD